jgi:hypothetical protein
VTLQHLCVWKDVRRSAAMSITWSLQLLRWADGHGLMGIGRPFQCLLADFVRLRQALILALDFSSGPLTNFYTLRQERRTLLQRSASLHRQSTHPIAITHCKLRLAVMLDSFRLRSLTSRRETFFKQARQAFITKTLYVLV